MVCCLKMAELFIIADLFLETNQDNSVTISCINQGKSRLESLILSQSKNKRRRKARVENYVETVLPLYHVDDFRQRFRIHRDTFNRLTEELTPILILGDKDGFMKIPVEKQVLIYIKYASSQQTIQSIADLFGVCEATVHNLVKRISTVICSELMPQLIKWPTGNKIQQNTRDFEERTTFPGVIGAIDGSHIPIRAPKDHPENYINRKGFHSVVLQAACDPNMHIIDVFCGWPGSVHDSRVLKNSSLYWLATNTNTMFPGNLHLLGDAAYPLLDWLLTPFKDSGNLNEAQKRYNFIHSSTRMVIERTFGSLKGRFRRLKFIDMMDMERIVKLTLSCCTLHELCLQAGDDSDEFIQEGMNDDGEVNNFMNILGNDQAAQQKRENISNLLQNRQN